jgi:hypothetical protein
MSAQCSHPERSEGPHKTSLITQITSRVQVTDVRSLAMNAAWDDGMSELQEST